VPWNVEKLLLVLVTLPTMKTTTKTNNNYVDAEEVKRSTMPNRLQDNRRPRIEKKIKE
jgi:hypothetical protein